MSKPGSTVRPDLGVATSIQVALPQPASHGVNLHLRHQPLENLPVCRLELSQDLAPRIHVDSLALPDLTSPDPCTILCSHSNNGKELTATPTTEYELTKPGGPGNLEARAEPCP